MLGSDPTFLSVLQRSHRRWLRLALLGASAAGLAALALLVYFRLGGGSLVENAQAAGPARALVAFAGRDSRVHLYESGAGRSVPIGTADHFGIIRVNPSGSLIAAVGTQESATDHPRLHLLEPSSGLETIVQLPQGPVVDLSWSPLHPLLAIVGRSIRLYDTAGGLVATSNSVAAADGTTLSTSGGGYGWSPDGATFAAVADGRLVVLRIGSVSEIPLDRLSVGVNPAQVSFDGWTIGGVPEPVIGISGHELAVSGGPNEAKPLPASVPIARVIDRSTRGHSAALGLAHSGTRPVWDRLSADGAAMVAQYVDANGVATVGVASISDPSRFSVVSGLLLGDTRGGALMDSVLLQ